MATKTKAGKISPDVRKLALELTRYLRPKDWTAQIHTLFEYVRDRIRYVRDINGVETLTDAAQTLEQGQGDCDDKAIVLASMLESIGHPTRFVAVGFAPGRFSHVVTETPLGSKWIALDPTEQRRMGWLPPGIVTRMVQNN